MTMWNISRVTLWIDRALAAIYAEDALAVFGWVVFVGLVGWVLFGVPL